MKTRRGFVSNSSSSSFVVGVPKGAKPKIRIVIEVDLDNFVDHHFRTIDAVELHFVEEYCHTEEAMKGDDEYKKMCEQIKKGNEVWIGSCSNNSEDPAEVFLTNNGLSALELPDGVEVVSDNPQ